MKAMKRSKFSIALICAVCAACITLGTLCVYSLNAPAARLGEAGNAASAPVPMKVCVPTLKYYAAPNLGGNSLGSLTAGSVVSASRENDETYRVYDENGETLGYCSVSGLVFESTKLIARVPASARYVTYVIEKVIYPEPEPGPEPGGEGEEGGEAGDGEDEAPDTAAPDTETDAPATEGGPAAPEPVIIYEEVTVLKHSELADVNEYAFSSPGVFAASSETVLAQRDLLEALLANSSGLSKPGLRLCIEAAYSASVPGELSGEELPASLKTGAVAKITCRNNAGSVVKVSSNQYSRNALSSAGLIRLGNTDWYYLPDCGDYLELDLNLSGPVYMIFE